MTENRRSNHRTALDRLAGQIADEALAMDLEELARRLNPARYADEDKKPKATLKEMALFEAALVKLVLRETRAANVRHFFYLAVSARIVNKTEQEAERVQNALVHLRRADFVPYTMIIDEARDPEVVPMWDNERDFFKNVVPQFQTDPWADADVTVLVFSEKRGMLPILREVTEEYRVRLYPMAGYTSDTALWQAAEYIKARGLPAVVLQLGDHDNSGRDMARAAEEWMRRNTRGIELTFVRVAVTEDHIVTYGLPTRPQKIDKRPADMMVTDAVEIDAMDPDDVQELLRAELRRYMPDDRLAAYRARDDRKRAAIARYIALRWRPAKQRKGAK